MKLALVNDWLTSEIGGGEKVIQSLNELFEPPLFTLVHNPKVLQKLGLHKNEVHSSFLQKMPFAKKKYRNYFPLFPLAVEGFDLADYDVVVSCSHSVAKGVLTNIDQFHLCYCYTPVRYAWDLHHQYLNDLKGIKKKLAKLFLHYIRSWDVHSANRVDLFVGISNFVAKRINKIYGKPAEVIYPPVNTDYFSLEKKKEDYYVTASRMVPYKKIDLIVEAFSKMPEKKLVVIGNGAEFKKVKSKATKNVELLGAQSNESLKLHLQRAKAFIFAAVEDFGILPVEAQSCGTPVIAYGRGAVLETVIKDKTGLFYEQQSPESLIDAIKKFEKREDLFDPEKIHLHARSFDTKRFQENFRNLLTEKYEVFIS